MEKWAAFSYQGDDPPDKNGSSTEGLCWQQLYKLIYTVYTSYIHLVV